MASPSNRELLTYSFVSQGIYGVNDRLSGILPFFLPIIKDMQGQLFDPARFVKLSNERYPWSLNTDICQELTPRFARAGWLKEIRHGNDISYVVLSIQDYREDEQRLRDAVSSLNELGQKFHGFLDIISPLQKVAYTEEDLQELLLEWLVDKRAFEKSSILAALETDQPSRRSGKKVIAEGSQLPLLPKRDEDYLCARFIEYVADHDDDLFEKLAALSAIAFVVEVALEIHRPTSEKVDLRRTEIYFDGPFAMDLLELSGKERHHNVSYIYERLHNAKAQLYIFAHSCDEIRDNLKAVLHAHPGERFGPTAEAMKKGEVLEDYVRTVFSDVESHVQRVGLTIRQFDMQSYPNTHLHFPEDLMFDLKARLPWEDLPSERDAKSVAFVMRTRGGNSSPILDRNRASLVSSNINLADIARRFCVEHGLIRGNQIGPVLHRRQLAAMLWLALGSNEKREITRRELLRRCADVVLLNPNVVRKARNILTAYDASKASQFEALISTPRASQMIMDLTLGIPDVISSKNIETILEEIKKTTVEDISKEHEEDIKSLKRRHKERIALAKEQHSAELRALQRDKEDLTQRAEEGKAHLDRLAQRLDELERRRVDSDRRICETLLRSVEQQELAIRSKLRKLASAVVLLVGVGSALITMGLAPWRPLLATIGVGIFFVAVITALQVSDHWMAPFEKWIFQRKLDIIERRLREIGRPELADQFDVRHAAHTVGILNSDSRGREPRRSGLGPSVERVSERN